MSFAPPFLSTIYCNAFSDWNKLNVGSDNLNSYSFPTYVMNRNLIHSHSTFVTPNLNNSQMRPFHLSVRRFPIFIPVHICYWLSNYIYCGSINKHWNPFSSKSVVTYSGIRWRLASYSATYSTATSLSRPYDPDIGSSPPASDLKFPFSSEQSNCAEWFTSEKVKWLCPVPKASTPDAGFETTSLTKLSSVQNISEWLVDDGCISLIARRLYALRFWKQRQTTSKFLWRIWWGFPSLSVVLPIIRNPLSS